MSTNLIKTKKIPLTDFSSFDKGYQPPCSYMSNSNNRKNCTETTPDFVCLNPAVARETDGDTVGCVIDRDLLDRPQHLEEFVKVFGNSGPAFDQIAERVCALTTTDNCPIDPNTDERLEKCMVLRQESASGRYCREWAANNKQSADMMKTEWCRRNENLYAIDCKCINRAFDKSYVDIKKYFPYNDTCWYVPCIKNGGYMNVDHDEKCDNINVCQIVTTITDANRVNIDNLKNYINCSQFPSAPSPAPAPPPVSPPSAPTNTALYVAIAIGALMILFLAMMR
ncbi:hypothetical protein AV955_gp065 [Diadromus pulchellus ascovirus 4a]|uniref:Complete DpAV4 genome n=1 Tax=Diadromus pulchellus ascovirus 4a TaxID=158683 RepID=F2NYZ4_9VIRU|nr:hypothetical protein AV955_gp065 [Diadromus pulchellus ascovirus 4a]CCA61422.1 unnamed protein product [Diadromus pulchellus ascovirus 4a]